MRISTFKVLALAAAMGLGLLAQTGKARAGTETLTVAGGCFWCVESDFESVKGVGDVVTGFTGGTSAGPTYESHGDHIEAAVIPFNNSTVNAKTLLDKFFRSIDPTDAGGQFCDRGHAYSTAVFVSSPQQRAAAEAAKAEAEAALGQKIVTPIYNAGAFFPVGAYHQDYYKSDERLAITSVGIGLKKSEAYKRYRKGCGRDARVKQLWGGAAAFTH
ncbi:peptide-methionine (S)-S-oxide reductase [Sulfitobacter brevis]|uniref:Peptide methionine sulfoxide reductase MsrA n=1 Tax=Sulfitobacter brevis TaxID=74348 RepID=A0A1I1Y8B6_9RHOB|nr:peptide-methionine (S)-S-oxide reductase MsrA [Sulfitobacter brevis]SFE15649.1 peptide-methionine (S)-S-oxide reductase [Sulfitobacter brevis]